MHFDISDIVFLVVFLSIVIVILNNDDWGGGRCSRVTADLPA